MKSIYLLFFFLTCALTTNAQVFQALRVDKASPTTTDDEVLKLSDSTYAYAEKAPEFPGGYFKFEAYINKNLRWPADSEGFEGRVLVTFIVEKDGSLTGVKLVDKGLSVSLNKEALKLVAKSPRWLPGTQRNIPVRVRYTVAIPFKTSEN
jgi:protein TonB